MYRCWTHAQYHKPALWKTENTTGVHVNVEVEQGILRGQEKISIFFPDQKYYSFDSIPYAKAPVGPLRFKDPEEPETWTGVRDVFGEEPEPPGPYYYHLEEFYRPPKPTDDCLYLDVDTPQVGESGKSVIVWIHPVHFSLEAMFGPRVFGVGHFMTEDVVFVNIRYRYSVLGFLCLDHEEVPGNAGLKDQVMALKWVQRNISKFSGDPNNVTLYGLDIAGAFAHYHLMSPLSAGLFHRVIIQGDCALNPHSHTSRENAIKKAFRIPHVLGQEIGNTDDLLDFLRAVPVADLLAAAEQTYFPGENCMIFDSPFGSPFTPCVEVPGTNTSCLTLTPKELLNQGWFTKVPTIMGLTNRQRYVWTKCCSDPPVPKNVESVANLAKVVGHTVNGEECGEWADDIKNFYFSHDSSAKEINSVCHQLLSDYAYTVGFYEAVRMQLQYTEEPVYVFEFPLIGLINPKEQLCIRCKPPDQSVFYNQLIKMWTSFAKTGNPNNLTVDVLWEPAQKNSFCYLSITNSLSSLMGGWIADDTMKMWQQAFHRYPDFREKYSYVYIRRVITETEKFYMEPDLQLLFSGDD